MKKILLYLACNFLLFGIGSCTKDTCNASLGNTFSSIHFDSLGMNDSELRLHCTSITLSDLPDSYFTNALAYDSLSAQISAINCSQTSIQLDLLGSYLPPIDSNRTYVLTYRFNDRRNNIDCKHAGSNDTYLLELSFDIDRIDSNSFQLTHFQWNEFFLAGYL